MKFQHLGFVSLAIISVESAVHAGIAVVDPAGYQTAKVDPRNTSGGSVGPIYSRDGWNAQSQIYTVDFQDAAFVAGQQLDSVKLTAIDRTITFSGSSGNGWQVTQGDRSVSWNLYSSGDKGISPITSSSNPFVISFDTPVTSVAMMTMFAGGGLRVTYFNSEHNELYHLDQNANGGGPEGTWKNYFFVYTSNTAISSVEITRLYVTDRFSIDDLSIVAPAPIPEPATLGVFALAGLALLTRRRS